MNRVLMITLLFGAVAACSTETNLSVHAMGENTEGEVVPLTNVKLDIIPYDIDELYDEIEAQTQPGPEPSADEITVMAQRYQDACTAYRVTSDSIEVIQQRATAISDRTSDEYHQVFEEYQALVEREKERFDTCQSITDEYTEVRNTYREERRTWEDSGWPQEAFDTAEAARMGELRAQQIETDADGNAIVTVPNGTWWVLGTAPVPGSISQRYRWNYRIDASGGEQAIELTGENATLQPVY